MEERGGEEEAHHGASSAARLEEGAAPGWNVPGVSDPGGTRLGPPGPKSDGRLGPRLGEPSDELGAGLGTGAGAAGVSGRAGELLEQLAATLRELLQVSPALLSDAEVRQSNQELFRLEQVQASVRHAHIRELDGRPEAVPGVRRGSAYRSLARHVLRQTDADAKADLAAAKMLDPGLASARGGMPKLAAALAVGEVSRAHVRRAVHVMEKIPAKFFPVAAEELAREFDPADAGKCGGDLIDELLTEASKEHAPNGTAKLADRLLRSLAPDEADRFDEQAHLRRSLTFSKDSTGMTVGRFQLDEASGAILTAVLSSLAEPRPARDVVAEDGSTIQISDKRSASQRYADALGEACRRAASTILDPLDLPDQPFLPGRPVLPEPRPASDSASPASNGSSSDGPASASASEGSASGGLFVPGQRQGSPGRALVVPGRGSVHGGDRLVLPYQEHPDERAADSVGNPGDPGGPGGVDLGAVDLGGGDRGGGRGGRAGRGPRSVTPRILILATPEQVRAATGGETCSCGGAGPAPDPGAAEDLMSGPVSRTHLAATVCDAVLQRVLQAPNGAVLNLGRAQRLFTVGQRAALNARDKGCVIPGCTMPAAWCDAHHLQEWAAGGGTDIDNGALACPGHHHQVHSGHWTIVMIDGIPWVKPPPWVDPGQRLVRNTFWDYERAAADLGRRLLSALASTGANLTPPATSPTPPADEGPIPPEWRVSRND